MSHSCPPSHSCPQAAEACPESAPQPVPPVPGLTEAEIDKTIKERRENALCFSPLLTSLAKWLNVLK